MSGVDVDDVDVLSKSCVFVHGDFYLYISQGGNIPSSFNVFLVSDLLVDFFD